MRDPAESVDIVGLGQNATDTIIRIPYFPAHDSKVEFKTATLMPGGQVASAMVACQKWGLKCRYIGKVGDDSAAELQAREMSKGGVEAQWITVKDCISQVAYILVDEATGERTIIWRRDARLDIHPDEVQQSWITSGRLLHVDGHNTAASERAARWARAAGIPVVADVDTIYPGLDGLLPWVDYLVTSKTFPANFLGEQDYMKSLPELAHRFRCRVVAASLGKDGVLAWERDGQSGRFLYAPAFDVRTVDTTGAGDIFHAGFLYGLFNKWGLPQILEFSCAAAALNCTSLGARGGIAVVEEIQQLTKQGARHQKAFPSFFVQG